MQVNLLCFTFNEQFFFLILEKLIYYPAFIGSSYLELTPQDISSDESNEIYVSIKTNQRDATILYSANQEADYKQASFIRLYIANGELRYLFSCDGLTDGEVETGLTVNTGDVYEIIIRYFIYIWKSQFLERPWLTSLQWWNQNPTYKFTSWIDFKLTSIKFLLGYIVY